MVFGKKKFPLNQASISEHSRKNRSSDAQEEADKEKKEWEQKLLDLYGKDNPGNKTEPVAGANEEGKK